MPIQNVGTLIENLVVTESAGVLLDHMPPGLSLGFATAFAMPPLSEWRTHSQAAGMSADALRRIRTCSGGTDFLQIMKACLQRSPEQGRNGALLVALLAAQKRKGLRVWANDIEDGHYGNAIPALQDLQGTVGEILRGCDSSLTMAVSSTPYPDSINDLKTTLTTWNQEDDFVLGFLDPMRYVRGSTNGPYTSSKDHRVWLSALRGAPVALSVHFTGNSDANSLAAELAVLRSDLEETGFPYWLEVRRQHYVVSVGAQSSDLLDLIETRTRASWNAWCDNVPEIKNRQLDLSRNARALPATPAVPPPARVNTEP